MDRRGPDPEGLSQAGGVDRWVASQGLGKWLRSAAAFGGARARTGDAMKQRGPMGG